MPVHSPCDWTHSSLGVKLRLLSGVTGCAGAGNGFTLIEVIVVSVIIAILAAVSIPMYNGYLRSARIDSAKNNCQLIGAAVMQAHSRGTDIGVSDWAAIGMQPLDDNIWKYTFKSQGGAFSAGVTDPMYTVHAEGIAGGPMADASGDFRPYSPAADRWTGTW